MSPKRLRIWQTWRIELLPQTTGHSDVRELFQTPSRSRVAVGSRGEAGEDMIGSGPSQFLKRNHIQTSAESSLRGETGVLGKF